MKDIVHLAALCAVPDLGPVTIRRLVAAFGSPEAVFRASVGDLMGVEHVGRVRAEAIRGFRGLDKIGGDIERVAREGVRVLTAESDGYPEALGQLGEDAPLVIYIKGGIMEVDGRSVAVIGSRKATPYGMAVAEKMSEELSAMGFTVVSGGARGIDTAAHRGGLRAGGRSIAVLGSGIDVPYPPENKGLFDMVARSGALISEFAPGTPPNRENFPRRNRLISGLSAGVLVVEAASRSGALITARHALEQGKEVFAVPGNISSGASAGTNELIRQGAKVALRAEDIASELAPILGGLEPPARETRALSALTREERNLYDIMSQEPTHIDPLTRQSGLPAAKVMGLLLGLELKGFIRQAEGKKFYTV